DRNLVSSKGLRRPSRLIILGKTNSAVSNVVKRSLQLGHSRRRRTCCPSPTKRESITLVSVALQKGQNILHLINRKFLANSRYLSFDLLNFSLIIEVC